MCSHKKSKNNYQDSKIGKYKYSLQHDIIEKILNTVPKINKCNNSGKVEYTNVQITVPNMPQ
jgi:hypothetical protein